MSPGSSVLVAGLDWPPETFLGRLIEGLLDGGTRVAVACADPPGPEWISRPGFEWIPQPRWNGPLARRLARAAAVSAAAIARGPREALDLDLSDGNTAAGRARAWFRLAPLLGRRADVAYFPWNAGAIAHLPIFDRFPGVVVSCRGAQVQVAPHNPRRAAIRDGLRESLSRATLVHCVSAAIAREAEVFGLDSAKAVVIRPGVDSSFFHPPVGSPQQDGVFRVVSVGSLIWRKGYWHALRAIRRMVDRTGADVEYRIVGAGPDRERVLFAAWDLGLADRVRAPGRMDPAGVRDHLWECDALLLSSHSEGIANAALEAMACGRPVVTTDCGGMPEAVADGVEGHVVGTRDSEGMARALEDLWSDPDRRRAMGAAGRRRVEREFTLERQVADFRRLFERAATHGRGDR